MPVGTPILAICRGIQVLNVSRGGTLHQHLPDAVGEEIVHRQNAAGERTTHSISVAHRSQLRTILGAGRIAVNSFHHQAVDELGHGLRAVAESPDGAIEGVEATDREWVIGVQWHAECLQAETAHARLFAAFVAAARRAELHGRGAPRVAA